MAEKRKVVVDKRTAGRYMEKGQLTQSEFDSYLKGLPDDSKNADYVQMDMDEPEMTSDDESEEENDVEE